MPGPMAVDALAINMAAGLSDERIGHEHTRVMGALGAAKLEQVPRHFLTSLR